MSAWGNVISVDLVVAKNLHHRSYGDIDTLANR